MLTLAKCHTDEQGSVARRAGEGGCMILGADFSSEAEITR